MLGVLGQNVGRVVVRVAEVAVEIRDADVALPTGASKLPCRHIERFLDGRRECRGGICDAA